MTSLRMFSVWDGGWKLGERVRLDGDEKLGKRVRRGSDLQEGRGGRGSEGLDWTRLECE